MNNSKIILCAALVSSAALFGCSKEVTSSANIRTPGIAALIDVTANDDTNSTVHADMRVGGSSSNTFLILESGDKLSAEAAGTRKDMTAQDEGQYEAEFSTAAADTEFKFKVMFERDADEDALANRGTMPAPFQIGEVPQDKPSRKDADVTLTWSPVDTASNMVVELNGTCIFNETIDVVGDEGMLVIPKGSLESTGGDMPKECEVNVTMRRSRTGTADPIFDKESWFKLHHVRTKSFVSAP
jgi:hypothetical protein